MKHSLRTKAVLLVTKYLPFAFVRQLYEFWSKCVTLVKYGEWYFPRIMIVEVSTHCNRSCAYCPNNHAPKAKELIKEEVLSKIISRLKDIKWSGVVDFIFFNEPLLHPSLADIVRRVKLACPKSMPRVSTNGDALKEKLMVDLIDAGIVRFYVMQHLPHRPGWMENIQYLMKKYPGYIVLMDIEQVEATTGLHTFGGLFQVRKAIEFKTCHIHELNMQIDVYGKVLLCCTDWERSEPMGDLLKEGILEVYKKPKFRAIRDNIRKGKPLTKLCKECMGFQPRTNPPPAIREPVVFTP